MTEAPIADKTTDPFIHMLKDKLIVLFLMKLGGSINLPSSELDKADGNKLLMRFVDDEFQFKLEPIE